MTLLRFDFRGAVDREQREVLKVKAPYISSSVFRMFAEGEDHCTLDPLQLHTLTSCGFNSSNPIIIITHGWSVRSPFLPLGRLENTAYKTWNSGQHGRLVAAVVSHVNVP